MTEEIEEVTTTKGQEQARSNKMESTITTSQSDMDDVILFVEYKYCTVCHIE
jgi:hypothetical protein